MIDNILTHAMLPMISRELLTRTIEGQPLAKVHVTVQDSEFACAYD